MVILHKNKIVHRDIKPENLMIKDDYKLVLLDFGMAKVSDKTTENTSNIKGTKKYMAPDAFQEFYNDNNELYIQICPKFDIWSIGCIFVQMCTGFLPWYPQKDDNAITRYLSSKKPYEFMTALTKPKFEDEFSILKSCLAVEKTDRVDASTLLTMFKDLRNKYHEKYGDYPINE